MAWIKSRIEAEKRKHGSMPEGLGKYNLDWARLAETKIITSIMDYCYKNNTIPLTELQNIKCECGHSLFGHASPDVIKKTGGACSNKFCACTGYNKAEVNPDLHLAMTDGGWINLLQLKKFLEDGA